MAKNRNFVNLNVNPCKMCMPLGACVAFKGIEKAAIIIHGSQGCSTYIRRHMAAHYNEPIDIASSSLTEKGTVYGGTENLKKGLENLIKLYNPKFIGIATTCLAETIGEDIKRVVDEFIAEKKEYNRTFVTVQTPGYGGSQFYGYYKAIRRTIEVLTAENETKISNKKINIIPGNITPKDIRVIKEVLKKFDIDYIMVPDISDTLDAPFNMQYKKLPDGGTKLEDISKMSESAATIELGALVDDEISPGKLLEEKFGVPLYRCAIPIGLKNTDTFMRILCKITHKEMPESIAEERGRMLDGLIDSHKFNGEIRAGIFGDPEIVYAVAQTCAESGIFPALIATGTKAAALQNVLGSKISGYDDETVVIDDTDFETIEKYVKDLKVNLLIGNSDGKFLTERHGIPLVRIGFPIHDRVGAQRRAYVCYEASMNFIDDITNNHIERKLRVYRGDMYDKYYKKEADNNKPEDVVTVNSEAEEKKKKIMELTKMHPCYGEIGSHEYARMHIPVAPKCNVQCNYCNRKYDCPNETRPGVTSQVLTPEEALIKFIAVKEKVPELKVIGIAGPGDALANFEETKKSIELIKENDPDVIFCLSTNGLMLPKYQEEIIKLGVNHVTITINAVDPEITAKIYKFINYEGITYTGIEGTKILLHNQLEGLKYLADHGVLCKVNIVLIKGINDFHIEKLVEKVKELGAFTTNIMPLIPTKDSAFEDMPLVSNQELNNLRKNCGKILKQMYHCKQCRADAIGKLGEDRSIEFRDIITKAPQTKNEEYTIAIATKSGKIIDQHFGHAEKFLIYKYNNNNITFMESKETEKYCHGPEECDDNEHRIEKIAEMLRGCTAVISERIGYEPKKKLKEMNIKTFEMYDTIENGINEAVKKLRVEV